MTLCYPETFLELYFPAIEMTPISKTKRQKGKYTIGSYPDGSHLVAVKSTLYPCGHDPTQLLLNNRSGLWHL